MIVLGPGLKFSGEVTINQREPMRGVPVRRYFTMGLTLLVILATNLFPAPPAQAEDIYPIIFPVAGPNHYTDTFYAPRSDGFHQATDIMADKMIPVLAAADGVVGWFKGDMGGNCCAMALKHDDGWSSVYIHLNNDTPGTDDGLGYGFLPGITSGVRVYAGQQIGWVGDSGNAEWTGPHLHFELHRPDGSKFNPYQSLLAAGSDRDGDGVADLADNCPSVANADQIDADGNGVGDVCEGWADVPVDHWARPSIDVLYENGITQGCDTDPLQFCPNSYLTRAEMATFLIRAVDGPMPSGTTSFSDVPLESWFAPFVEGLFSLGLTSGCSTTSRDFCPQGNLTRGEIAAFLVRAMGIEPLTEHRGYFADAPAGSWYTPFIERLAEMGVMTGFDDGNIQPDQPITRAEMAVLVDQALVSR